MGELQLVAEKSNWTNRQREPTLPPIEVYWGKTDFAPTAEPLSIVRFGGFLRWEPPHSCGGARLSSRAARVGLFSSGFSRGVWVGIAAGLDRLPPLISLRSTDIPQDAPPAPP